MPQRLSISIAKIIKAMLIMVFFTAFTDVHMNGAIQVSAYPDAYNAVKKKSIDCKNENEIKEKRDNSVARGDRRRGAGGGV